MEFPPAFNQIFLFCQKIINNNIFEEFSSKRNQGQKKEFREREIDEERGVGGV